MYPTHQYHLKKSKRKNKRLKTIAGNTVIYQNGILNKREKERKNEQYSFEVFYFHFHFHFPSTE